MGREATRAVSGGRPSVAEALRAHATVFSAVENHLKNYLDSNFKFFKGTKKNSSIFHLKIVTCDTKPGFD